jgi:hypothetical protein
MSFSIKSDPWESRAVLTGVTCDSITFIPEFVDALESAFWIELATEYDAEHFCEHLLVLEKQGHLRRSSDFLAFEKAWRRDELNHTYGFARIYSLLYGIPEDELFARLRLRRPNFDALASLFVDEFTICVVIAYDEIATTRSYQRDLVHRYPVFNNPALVRWIRLVARDEAWHFENALNVIEANHQHRVAEVPAVLDQLVNWDARGEEYGATFVLDHNANNYDRQLLESCRTIILNRFGLGS